MQEEKSHNEEVEFAYRNVKETVLTPLFSRFSSFECQPVVKFITRKVLSSCYTQLFHIFSVHHQSDDNYQEYIYNQVSLAVEVYYKELSNNIKCIPYDRVIDIITCKWKEMMYIQEVLVSVLLYVENNYIKRTEKVSIKEVVLGAFVSYLYRPLQENILNSIRRSIRKWRQGKVETSSSNYKEATQIVKVCSNHHNMSNVEKLDRLIIDDVFHSYKNKRLNIESLPSVMKDLDYYCSQEKSIAEFYGLDSLYEEMQQRMLQCVMNDTIFSTFLHKHMDQLFPNDFDTLNLIYHYAIQLEKGVETMSIELKRVFTNLGLNLFSTYEKRLKETTDCKKLNWEYITCLCKHFYSHYQMIKEKLHEVGQFYQALYSSMTAVTDRCLRSDCSVPTGLAQLIDSRIRKNVVITAEFSKELDEMIFLYSNLSNKDEFLLQYTILLSRRLLYFPDRSFDTERNIIAKIQAITGVLSVNAMNSILSDYQSNSSQSLIRRLEQSVTGTDYNLSLHILTKGIWPTSPECENEDLKHTNDIILPSDMSVVTDRFNEIEKDSERNYSWSFTRGQCTVDVTLPNHQTILIQMLPIHYIVLSQFSGDNIISFDELKRNTNVDSALLKKVLSSFVYGKVNLIRKVGDSPGIEEKDSFVFNSQFTTNQKNIRMNTFAEEHKTESDQNSIIKFTESYKACIVRYVKHNKRVAFKTLKDHVMTEMKKWSIEEEDFVKCVDSLIESEYIQRNEKNSDIIEFS